jgi:hypothetical protein
VDGREQEDAYIRAYGGSAPPAQPLPPLVASENTSDEPRHSFNMSSKLGLMINTVLLS